MPYAMTPTTRSFASEPIVGGYGGRWQALDNAITMQPKGGKFVGRLTADGADKGKLALISGSNTGGKVMGFFSASKEPNWTQLGIHERAANPDYVYTAGQELYLVNDLTAEFRVQVKGDIKTIKSGMAYGLVVDTDGLQYLDASASGAGPVIVTDEITEASANYVRVKFNPAAIA